MSTQLKPNEIKDDQKKAMVKSAPVLTPPSNESVQHLRSYEEAERIYALLIKKVDLSNNKALKRLKDYLQSKEIDGKKINLFNYFLFLTIEDNNLGSLKTILKEYKDSIDFNFLNPTHKKLSSSMQLKLAILMQFVVY